MKNSGDRLKIWFNIKWDCSDVNEDVEIHNWFVYVNYTDKYYFNRFMNLNKRILKLNNWSY